MLATKVGRRPLGKKSRRKRGVGKGDSELLSSTNASASERGNLFTTRPEVVDVVIANSELMRQYGLLSTLQTNDFPLLSDEPQLNPPCYTAIPPFLQAPEFRVSEPDSESPEHISDYFFEHLS